MIHPMNARPSVHPRGRMAGGRRQRGAGMLEVLVSILIISFGLLGVAGLTAATFSYNKTAQIRLVGLALVNDYADRARINVYGYDLDEYSIGATDTAPTITSDPDPDEANQKTAAEAVAANDRAYFMNAVAARLPQGKAVVASNPTLGTSDRGMDIWLMWKEASTDDGSSSVVSAAEALFTAGQDNCPDDIEESDGYSCMYFRVGL